MRTWLSIGIVGFSLLTLRAQDQPVITMATNDVVSVAEDAAPTTNVLDMVEVLKTPVVFTNSIGMVMVPVPAGYWVGKFEVRQDEYQAVMKSNPSHFSRTNNPVDSVSWNNAMQFCEKLTLLERKKSNLPVTWLYILPTDAQWEMLVGDAALKDAITSEGQVGGSRKNPQPVGTLNPNSFGLYDMRGNVMEFQLDRADYTQTYRVLRGGAYDTWFEVNLRPAFRHYAASPDDAQPDYGFRCIMVMQAPPTPAPVPPSTSH